jgi:hypothetical protein
MKKFLYVLCQIVLIAAFAFIVWLLLPERQFSRE